MEDNEGVDAAEEVGVDGSDILLHAVENDIKGAFLILFKSDGDADSSMGLCKKIAGMTQTNISIRRPVDFRGTRRKQCSKSWGPRPYFASLRHSDGGASWVVCVAGILDFVPT
jgi:hypothetical protein